MCNRYQQAETAAAKKALAALEAEVFNSAGPIIHPQGQGEIMRVINGKRTISQMTWGFPLILADARKRAEAQGKHPKPKPVNNARTDKLSSPFWKRWTQPEYRCIIPVTRYAEAYGPKGKMKEVWVSIPDQELIPVAGLWRPGNEWGNCYTMVMTDAAGEAAEVHNRMPVILDQKNVSAWLSDPVEQAIDLCRPWQGDVQIEWSETSWAR
ncbi:SOS response-associated peptidase family protein [Parasphingorhabdus sp. JC815]|uniref:SOS response-associated peptidase family protein n=1 Tax=Parasphingorhabdus sp. JC815 TaxID=3232140 RepID=UPI00345B1F18